MMKKEILEIMRTFKANIDFAYKVGEESGCFARDCAIKTAWQIFDEDVENFDEETIDIMTILAVRYVNR